MAVGEREEASRSHALTRRGPLNAVFNVPVTGFALSELERFVVGSTWASARLTRSSPGFNMTGLQPLEEGGRETVALRGLPLGDGTVRRDDGEESKNDRLTGANEGNEGFLAGERPALGQLGRLL